MDPFQTPPANPAQPQPASSGGGEAITAVIFSTLSFTQIFVHFPIFTVFAMLCAVVGIVLGHIALARSTESANRIMAVIALAFGYFNIVIALVRLLVFTLYVIHASNTLFHQRRFLR